MAEGAMPVTASQRWLARLAYLAMFAAVLVLVIGGRSSLAVVAVGVLGLGLMLAGIWWFLSNRGTVRWLAAVLAVGAPTVVIVLYISRDLLWAVVLVAVLVAIAVAAARAALIQTRPRTGMPEQQTPPPAHPFLIMNPRSGGGKVRRFNLDETASALGADVALLEGPGPVDVAELARRGVAGGADLLGVAGGDGTQALVAGIAAAHDVPFLVVSAGTRNHFAMDLGLDREHPDADLDALTDGVEIRLDLGEIGGRTFVNNASFGAYAEVVQSPAYRDDKRGTTLQMLPDLLSGQAGPGLTVSIDGEVVIRDPKALLVSNNPYEQGDLAGLGRRARLDTGVLGVVAVTVDSAAQAAGLLRGRQARGLRRLEAHEVVVDSDAPEISVGIDGEAVLMPTPVRCTIRPLALRVRVARTRPGVPVAQRPIDMTLLRHQALTLRPLARSGHDGHDGHPDDGHRHNGPVDGQVDGPVGQVDGQVDGHGSDQNGGRGGSGRSTQSLRSVLLPLALAQFICSFAGSNMNVMITDISKDLDTTVKGVQTAITLFLLIMAALMIPAGKLTDRWGRKRCFMFGLTVYGIGALMSALSPGLGVLILGNSVLEGVGTALLIPPVYILTTMLFVDTASRARAFGAISGMGGIGAAAGPLLGGLITTAISWRAAFAFQALIVAAIVILSRKLEDPVAPDPTRPFDTVGAILSAAGLVCLVTGILQADNNLWLMAAFIIVGALLLLWFFRHVHAEELRGEEPLLSTSLFRSRVSNLGLITQNIQWLILMGTSFVVSAYLQVVRGYNAIQTGVIFTAATVGILTTSLAAGRLAKKYRQRSLIVVGFVTTLGGIVLLLAMAQAYTSPWASSPGLLLIGLGGGLMMTPSVNVVQSSFPDEQQGEISGLSRSVSNLGSSLGTAVAGTILVAGLVERSYALAMITLAVLGVVGLVAAWLLPATPVSKGVAASNGVAGLPD